MTHGLAVAASIVLLMLAIGFIRIPIGMLLALIGFAGYAFISGFSQAVTMMGNEFWSTFSNSGLTVVPLFVLMGQICFHSGLSGRLYASIATLVGHKKGGIASATLIACGGFSAICGSNTATAATMSVVSLPEMLKRNYPPALASGVVASGTTLGAVIPPSVVAIVIAIQTRESIQKLFVGGILPGLVLMGLFVLTVAWLARVRPALVPAGKKATAKERLTALPGLVEALALFGIVVGGLSSGLFAPSEAGGAGAFAALLIGLARRGLSLREFGKAVFETMNISAMIFLLLAGAGCYGKFLSVSRTPFMVAQAVQDLAMPVWAILALIFLVYLIGGMIMDALALLLITLPIFFPLVSGMGVDTLWFCLVIMVITTLGAITPPVGASAYVVASTGGIPLGDVFRGTVFFLPAFIICLAVMILFPGLVLFLPGFISF